MITDIHRHFVPDEYFEFVRSRPDFFTQLKCEDGTLVDTEIRGIRFGLNTTFFDLNLQLKQLAGQGVDRAVLSLATPFVDYYVDGALAIEAARILNDALASTVRGHSTRFFAWAFLPMQVPSAAAMELRRCVEKHGFIGGHVASNVRGIYLNDKQFEPVFQTAVDLNVPLFVHPADPAGRERTREYELTVVAGYLFDSTINILKLICSGLLDRWPSLKLVCAHAGGFALPLRARMQREIDTNPILSKMVTGTVGECLRKLYFDSICFEPKVLQYAIEIVSPAHVLLGSDVPFPLGEPDPVGFIRGAVCGDAASMILSDNFEHLLRG